LQEGPLTRQRAPLALSIVALALGGAALGVALSGDDDGEPARRVVVVEESPNDPTPDKDIQVFCPKGFTPVGGGGLIPHGNDTPGVAIYWSAPYENGWEVAAQDAARRTRPWVLTAQVVCLEPVRDATNPGGALPAETTGG
jgi:hypothetical protein